MSKIKDISATIEAAIQETCNVLSAHFKEPVEFKAGKFYHQNLLRYYSEPECTDAICYQLGYDVIINYPLPANLITLIGKFYEEFFLYIGDMNDSCQSVECR